MDATNQLLEILPIVFVATLIIGAIALITSNREEEREESKHEDALELEISKIKELQRRKL